MSAQQRPSGVFDCMPSDQGFHTQLQMNMHAVDNGAWAADNMLEWCKRHDRDSLPRVRFWVRAFQSLERCYTAADVDALFASLLTDYTRDYIDCASCSSVSTVTHLFYNACAQRRFYRANQRAAGAKMAELKAADSAQKASDSETSALERVLQLTGL